MTQETFEQAQELYDTMAVLERQIDIVRNMGAVTIHSEHGDASIQVPASWVKSVVLDKLEQGLNNTEEVFRGL